MKISAKLTRFLLPLGIIAISILIFVALFKSKPPAQQKVVEEKIWFVESQVIKLASHQPIVSLIAKVTSAENIEISSTIDADVEKRWVSVGDKVKKGQKLLSFDKTTLKLVKALRQSELNEATASVTEENKRHEIDLELLNKEKAVLKIANNAVKRAQTLEKSAMASSSQLDDAKRASLNQQIAITKRQLTIDNHSTRLLKLSEKQKVATVRLAIAEDDLLHTDIFAPVNGIITQIDLDQGEHVRIGSSLITLYNDQKLELKAFVPEKYISTILDALNNNITLTGVTKTTLNESITLSRIGGEIQNNTAGSYLYFLLNNLSNKGTRTSTAQQIFLPGQTIPIQLALPTIDNTIALPSNALYGVEHIFLIKDSRLQRINVQWHGETLTDKTNTTNIKFLLSSPQLKNDDIVVISKFANAMNGLKVTTSSNSGSNSKSNESSSTSTNQ